MSDIFRAMSVSGGILLVVVIFVVGVSIATVNRGANAMRQDEKQK